MTIQIIFVILTIAIVGLLSGSILIYAGKDEGLGYVFCGIATFVITLIICIGISWWQLNSASGKRAYKTQQSNFVGGIERTITVYDVNGEIIESYSGKFDIDYDDDRIVFDDEDNKRHVIFYPTGTVIVNED